MSDLAIEALGCPACGRGGLPEGLRVASAPEIAFGSTAVFLDTSVHPWSEVHVVACLLCDTGRAIVTAPGDHLEVVEVTNPHLDAPDGALLVFDDHIARVRHGDEWVPLRFAA